ncbi:hypothetical protein BX666DRAFT_1928150 [Dichotomocladium elegans]|nr:hypothetical protein BX666DRAFT_1928150 [Dichotomocladium elegans]
MIESSASYYFPDDKLGLLQHEFPSPPDSHAFASSFPSPTCSNTSSLDSPSALFDLSTLQNLPISVLQSISALYQPSSTAGLYFDENTHTDIFNTMTTTASTATTTTPPSTIVSSPSITIPARTVAETAAASPPLAKPAKAQRPPRQLECYNCHVTKTPLWRRTPDRAHSLCNACGLYYKQYGTHRPLHIRQKQQQVQAQPQPLGKKRRADEEEQQQQQQVVLPSPTPSSITVPFSTAGTANIPEAAASAGEEEEEEEEEEKKEGTKLLQCKYEEQDTVNDDQSCSNCKQTNTPLWRKNERGESVCNACGLYARQHQRDRPSTMHRQKAQKRRRQDTSSSSSATVVTPSPADERFNDLLGNMTPEQMQRFLVILEKRCALLRSILYGGADFQTQQNI